MANPKPKVENLTNMGKGRVKGVKNKSTLLKEMVINTVDKMGGEAWLKKIAEEQPLEFLKIASKTFPKEIIADIDFKEVGVVVLPDKED